MVYIAPVRWLDTNMACITVQTERLLTMLYQQGLSNVIMCGIEISGHCRRGFNSISVLADLPNLGEQHHYHNFYLRLAFLLFVQSASKALAVVWNVQCSPWLGLARWRREDVANVKFEWPFCHPSVMYQNGVNGLLHSKKQAVEVMIPLACFCKKLTFDKGLHWRQAWLEKTSKGASYPAIHMAEPRLR